VSQGIIGVECRADDERTLSRLNSLEHPATRIAMDAERAFAHRLGGSCQSPIAAYARLDAGGLTLDGLVAEPDGSRLLREQISGHCGDSVALGKELAERVLAAGADALLARLRTD
jgi:hydroxymethylbilane synthase